MIWTKMYSTAVNIYINVTMKIFQVKFGNDVVHMPRNYIIFLDSQWLKCVFDTTNKKVIFDIS